MGQHVSSHGLDHRAKHTQRAGVRHALVDLDHKVKQLNYNIADVFITVLMDVNMSILRQTSFKLYQNRNTRALYTNHDDGDVELFGQAHEVS